MIKTVIFDMDGLMIDSERVTYEWYRRYLQKRGEDMTVDFYKNLLGKIQPVCKSIIANEYGEDFPYEECIDYVHKGMAEEFETKGVPLKKGIVQLLKYLKENNYKTMVATSSNRDRVDVILKQAGIAQYFDGEICGDEVVNGKPNPEVFLKACKKVNVQPEEALVLEDSEAGIKAAHDGGIKVICIPDMKYPEEEYRKMTEEIFEDLSKVVTYF